MFYLVSLYLVKNSWWDKSSISSQAKHWVACCRLVYLKEATEILENFFEAESWGQPKESSQPENKAGKPIWWGRVPQRQSKNPGRSTQDGRQAPEAPQRGWVVQLLFHVWPVGALLQEHPLIECNAGWDMAKRWLATLGWKGVISSWEEEETDDPLSPHPILRPGELPYEW